MTTQLQAIICIQRMSQRTLYQVHLPDGLYHKLISEHATLEGAQDFCREQGWTFNAKAEG